MRNNGSFNFKNGVHTLTFKSWLKFRLAFTSKPNFVQSAALRPKIRAAANIFAIVPIRFSGFLDDSRREKLPAILLLHFSDKKIYCSYLKCALEALLSAIISTNERASLKREI